MAQASHSGPRWFPPGRRRTRWTRRSPAAPSESGSGHGCWSTRRGSPRDRLRPHRRAVAAAPPRGVLLQGPLLCQRRPGAVQAPHLPRAGARRPRRASDLRPGRTCAVRPRHRVGRPHRLRLRSGAVARLLRRYPALLARPARWRAGAGLQRHQAEALPPGGPATDFAIEGPETHGLAGLVNLFGIESPGLTASLAIAEEVLARATA